MSLLDGAKVTIKLLTAKYFGNYFVILTKI
nr:MAG TPA_asm: hypothetical protein [Caudoviricetes sp.]